MFCPECGNETNGKFCIQCGAELLTDVNNSYKKTDLDLSSLNDSINSDRQPGFSHLERLNDDGMVEFKMNKNVENYVPQQQYQQPMPNQPVNPSPFSNMNNEQNIMAGFRTDKSYSNAKAGGNMDLSQQNDYPQNYGYNAQQFSNSPNQNVPKQKKPMSGGQVALIICGCLLGLILIITIVVTLIINSFIKTTKKAINVGEKIASEIIDDSYEGDFDNSYSVLQNQIYTTSDYYTIVK